MYANVVNNYTKSKFSVIFPICLFKYISPKFKWREKGEHMYKDYKGSKTRTKYKFVPAVNG